MQQNLLQPFDYHIQLKDHFKKRKKTWNWFKDKGNKTKQIEKFKSDLLKNSYRLERSSHPKMYNSVKEICMKLNIDAEVTLYQENNSIQLNAGISIFEKEAHIILSGNLISLLTVKEMKALLAHELSHYLFYKIEDEDFETTNRIIIALANDSLSETSMIETARIYQLYMELFCDSGALSVCDDYKTVIQMLVKLNTGISEVNAESYLNQAREIISNQKEATNDDTHPESYIRSLALFLKSENNKDYLKQIKPLIEGALDLDKMDVFEQKTVGELTSNLLRVITKPSWINSSSIMNLCQQYFPDFSKSQKDLKIKDLKIKDLADLIKDSKPNIHNYLSYVLFDFANVDKDLEGAPLAYTLEISEILGIEKTYEKIIKKEFKLNARDFKKFKVKVANELMELSENKNESLYDE